MTSRQLGVSVCPGLLSPEPVRSSGCSGLHPCPHPTRGHRPWGKPWRPGPKGARGERPGSGVRKDAPGPGTHWRVWAHPPLRGSQAGVRWATGPLMALLGTLSSGLSDLPPSPIPPLPSPHTNPAALGEAPHRPHRGSEKGGAPSRLTGHPGHWRAASGGQGWASIRAQDPIHRPGPSSGSLWPRVCPCWCCRVCSHGSWNMWLLFGSLSHWFC